MHQAQKNLSTYQTALHEALDNSFLRATLDKFAINYKANRKAIFADIDEQSLINQVATSKDAAAKKIDQLYNQFKSQAEAQGIMVHLAKTAHDANMLIAKIAKDNQVKLIVKSKSMTAEETQLNAHLEAKGLEVCETDLGEWIIQLRHEGPSHMVMPAIHLSRQQVAADFSKATGKEQSDDIAHLVKVARAKLRPKFIAADMGISGANFAIAETGTLALLTNEGNARLVTTLPKVHVALLGLDKLIPTWEEALTAMQILPRNATAQKLTSYVSLINGAEASGQQTRHIIFLDNGRSAIAKDPIFSQIFRCVRCGACANVCPVYRLVGGHKMGYIYIGAIGLILTYLFHDQKQAKILAQNCLGCEACKQICAGGIDLPHLIREVRQRLNSEIGSPPEAKLLSALMKNRQAFHALLKFAKFAQLPISGGTAFQRHLPAILLGQHGYKALPAIAAKSFRDQWADLAATLHLQNPAQPKMRIALFAGCAQDFVYPEQLVAACRILSQQQVAVDFPWEQSCCGLPLEMMGQRATSLAVAQQNITAFNGQYDAIITLCASCASHLKHTYPKLLNTPETAKFSSKIMDFASFCYDVLGLRAKDFKTGTEKVTYHASCHLCRGLQVHEAPRELIKAVSEYIPSAEEELCCGFGGTYSAKFPEMSANILNIKLQHAKDTGANRLVVDCPGCVMQLRGGAVKQGLALQVSHLAELLAENLPALPKAKPAAATTESIGAQATPSSTAEAAVGSEGSDGH